VQYDPAKSETYKTIQELEHGDLHAQEISKPVQPKVYTPVQGSVKVSAAMLQSLCLF